MTHEPSPNQGQPSSAQSALHLPGLNALRFYAAISVVIAHTDHNFAPFRTQPAGFTWLNALAMDAQSAVSLFFVLSGFLITFLLLRERSGQGTIAVGRFYIRRMLRIWPLYYLIVGIGFLFIPAVLPDLQPYSGFPAENALLVLFLLPNFVTGLGPLEHLWSIGLEEQFYLTWPWVLKHKENLLRVILGILIVKILVFPAVLLFHTDSVTNLYYGLRFECMAIGGLGAFLYHTQHRFLHYLYSLPSKISSLIGIVLLALIDFPVCEPLVLLTAFLFMILLLNLSTGPQWGLRLEIPVLNGLGQMSYGIYMYHYPLLYLVLAILRRSEIQEGDLYSAILYGMVVSGTLVLAFISYRWFESPFLRLKDTFAFIHTRS